MINLYIMKHNVPLYCVVNYDALLKKYKSHLLLNYLLVVPVYPPRDTSL